MLKVTFCQTSSHPSTNLDIKGCRWLQISCTNAGQVFHTLGAILIFLLDLCLVVVLSSFCGTFHDDLQGGAYEELRWVDVILR